MLRVPSVVKTAVSVGAHLTGLSRLIAARYRGRGIIFALHSVVEDGAIHPDDSLRCPAGQLQRVLRWLRDQRFEFVDLDEAVRRLAKRETRPFAAFTFDDGYADNLTRALPIMQRFEAPFTVYVTTGMVTREIDAWWFGLAELIRSRERVDLPGIGRRFRCADLASKKRVFRTIEAAIHEDFDVLPHVRSAIAASGIDCRTLVDREGLTASQLGSLARHPLVSIGGHTTTHRNLALASVSTVRREMMENRKFLQGMTDSPVAHFAYPFGHARACGLREANVARDVGFCTAVTTRSGALFAAHVGHPHALPRIHLAGDDTRSTLRCKLDGVYRAIHSRWGDPVALM
jgi:peptidoglycan/xylan/chitin deacetylase (PgdA/CDA1 family)